MQIQNSTIQIQNGTIQILNGTIQILNGTIEIQNSTIERSKMVAVKKTVIPLLLVLVAGSVRVQCQSRGEGVFSKNTIATSIGNNSSKISTTNFCQWQEGVFSKNTVATGIGSNGSKV